MEIVLSDFPFDVPNIRIESHIHRTHSYRLGLSVRIFTMLFASFHDIYISIIYGGMDLSNALQLLARTKDFSFEEKWKEILKTMEKIEGNFFHGIPLDEKSHRRSAQKI